MEEHDEPEGPIEPAGRIDSEHPADSSLLGDGSPLEILERLAQSDPLGLDDLCYERLCARAILLDNGRLYARALARVAHQTSRRDERTELSTWLIACIDWSITSLLEEDSELERRGLPALEPWDPAYAFLAESLGVEAPKARRLALVFNELPDRTRQTFWALVMEGKSRRRWIAEGHGPPEEVDQHLEYALEMMSTLGESERPLPGRPADLGDETDELPERAAGERSGAPLDAPARVRGEGGDE